MALTPFRWIAALVASCLLVAVIVLRAGTPPRREVDFDTELTHRMGFHGRHAANAAARLRLAQLMDSTGVTRKPPANVPAVRVLHDAAFSAEARLALDSVGWRAVSGVRDTGVVGMDVMFLLDTVKRVRGAEMRSFWGTHVNYVLPRSTDDRCTAIAHVEGGYATPYSIAVALPTESSLGRLTGPCAYFRAFGMPGPRIDEWLRVRGWTFAGDGSWERAEEAVDLGKRSWDYSSFEAQLGRKTSLPLLREMHLDAVRCAASSMDGCLPALMARRYRGRPTMMDGHVLFQAYSTLGRDQYRRFPALGRREPFLLADMVRTLGRERFARFWTSGDAVPVAFEKAAGEPLEQWTSRWIVAQYGPVPPRGAGLNVRGGWMSIVLVLLALGTALGVNARRQFR